MTNAGHGPNGVIELLVQLTGQYDAHDFADQLRLLREDLRDPVLRARGRAWVATLTDAVEERLGRIPTASGRDVSGLGELIVAYWQGTLTVWSFTRDRPSVDYVRTALEQFLARLTTEPT